MESKIIIIGNLKGGVGKSSLTSMFATYIHRVMKEPVVVIDADDDQKTIRTIREDEISQGADENNLFPILNSNSIDAPDSVRFLLDDYKYIFIDLPGNLKQEGVKNSYLMADLIIIPTSLSKEDLDSTIKFITYLNAEILPRRETVNLKTDLMGILYKVRKRGKDYYDFLPHRHMMPITFFETVVPPSEVFKRQTNTLEIIQYETKSFKMADLLEEFNNIIK